MQEHEERSLEEIDASRREQLQQVEAALLRFFAHQRPTTISELGDQVRRELGDIENSLIRAALLRLLNDDRLPDGGQPPSAV